MYFSDFKKHVELLSEEESNGLRDLYIEQFVDTNSELYLKNIAKIRLFSDGYCYTGYLWDSLNQYRETTLHHVFEELSDKKMILVLWDIHSCERILIENYWRFPKDRVIKVDAEFLKEGMKYLPEDIYIFDYDITWSYIITHEDDGKRRICFEVKKQN